MEDFKVVKVDFIDEDRYHVALEATEIFLWFTYERNKNVPVGFFFNLDEAG